MEQYQEERYLENSFLEFKSFLPPILNQFMGDKEKLGLVKQEIIKQIETNKNILPELQDRDFSTNFIRAAFQNIYRDQKYNEDEIQDSESVLAVGEALSTWAKMTF